MSRWYSAVIVLMLALGCRQAPPEKQYQLTGQILAVKPESQEVVIKHEDIPGFMMAMTMPYKVNDAALIADKTAGDLITATLVVGETTAYISAITRTGHAEVGASTQPEISALDMLKIGDRLPDASLLGQDDRPLPLSSYKGHRLALTFIYTRCPDPEFCPLLNQHFLAVQKTVQNTPGLEDVQLLSISFDPSFDTPAVLTEQASKLQADPTRWRFAADTADLAKRFGVSATASGEQTIVHNLGTAVVDANGRVSALHSDNRWTPADLVAELTAAAAPAR